MSFLREPDAGDPPVRFDEREQETESCQTGLRRQSESRVNEPPGDYSHCACSRLYRLGRTPTPSPIDFAATVVRFAKQLRSPDPILVGSRATRKLHADAGSAGAMAVQWSAR
jgi:hypothetical protein